MIGLHHFDPSTPEQVSASVANLLRDVLYAFLGSAFAIAFSILVTMFEKWRLARCYKNLESLTASIDQLFEGGVGEDYLSQLLSSTKENTTHAKQLKDGLVSDLREMLQNLVDSQVRENQKLAETLSSTYRESGQQIAEQVSGAIETSLKSPLDKIIDSVDALPAIEQQFFETSAHGKIPLLQTLLSQHQPASCVVFCNTKKDCQAVCDALNEAGQSALALHGDLEQRDRDQTLVRFANGSARVLVATDVAARGLDIKSLELVVNFELAWDPEVHVHRIGRTARAGNSGLAISFCAPEEAQRANILSEMLQIPLNWVSAPAQRLLTPLVAEMATLCIDGGKKAKMRPGDVLGALTGDIGLDGADIGKITVHPGHVYVAVRQSVAHKAWKQLQNGKIKGKTCRVRLLK